MRTTPAIFIAVFLLAGCAPPPSLQTPQGRAAYQADQVVQRIGEFQNAVIDASNANKVKVQDARQIVSWCVATLDALQHAPQGWSSAAREGWAQIRPLVVGYAVLAPYVPVIDALTQGVQ